MLSCCLHAASVSFSMSYTCCLRIVRCEFADSVACRIAHCQHAAIRVAIMPSASRHVFRMACDGLLCAWLADVSTCLLVVCIVPVCWRAICCSSCFPLDYLPTLLVVLVCLPEGRHISLPLEYRYTVLYTRKDDSRWQFKRSIMILNDKDRSISSIIIELIIRAMRQFSLIIQMAYITGISWNSN